MTKFYTRKGDRGTTSMMRGKRMRKTDSLVEAIGDVDELNSSIGVSLFYTRDEYLRSDLRAIQNDLFSIGAVLASLPGKPVVKFEESRVKRLERSIDEMDRKLPQLTKFILPGGSEEASHLHLARSVARRAERKVVAASDSYKIDAHVLEYMNRLSSFLFAAALYANRINGIKENNPIY